MGVDDPVHDLTPEPTGPHDLAVACALRELLDGGDRQRSDPERLLAAVRAGARRRRRRRAVATACTSAVVAVVVVVTVAAGVQGWFPHSSGAPPTSEVRPSWTASPPLRMLRDDQVRGVFPGSSSLLMRGYNRPECSLCSESPVTNGTSTWGISPSEGTRSPVPLPAPGTITLVEELDTWADSSAAARYPALLATSTRDFDSKQAGEPSTQFFTVPAALGPGLVMGTPTIGDGGWSVTVVGVRGTVTVRLEAEVGGLVTDTAGRAAGAQVAALAVKALDRAAGP